MQSSQCLFLSQVPTSYPISCFCLHQSNSMSIHHISNAMIMPSVEDTDNFAMLVMEHTVEPLQNIIFYIFLYKKMNSSCYSIKD
jgi:hypothetical protein